MRFASSWPAHVRQEGRTFPRAIRVRCALEPGAGADSPWPFLQPAPPPRRSAPALAFEPPNVAIAARVAALGQRSSSACAAFYGRAAVDAGRRVSHSPNRRRFASLCEMLRAGFGSVSVRKATLARVRPCDPSHASRYFGTLSCEMNHGGVVGVVVAVALVAAGCGDSSTPDTPAEV